MTNTSTFEEELERNGILIYTNRGDSMMPLLRENRDSYPQGKWKMQKI